MKRWGKRVIAVCERLLITALLPWWYSWQNFYGLGISLRVSWRVEGFRIQFYKSVAFPQRFEAPGAKIKSMKMGLLACPFSVSCFGIKTQTLKWGYKPWEYTCFPKLVPLGTFNKDFYPIRDMAWGIFNWGNHHTITCKYLPIRPSHYRLSPRGDWLLILSQYIYICRYRCTIRSFLGLQSKGSSFVIALVSLSPKLKIRTKIWLGVYWSWH